MVTNNFKKLIFSYLFNSGEVGTGNPYAINNVSAVRTSGVVGNFLGTTSRKDAFNANINCFNHISTDNTANGYLHVKVGTGTTAPTADDYELESVNSDITVSSASTAPTDSSSRIYTVTLNNPTDNDINITEIGLYGMLGDFYGIALAYNEYLLDRTVLSTPITIPAGQSKSITYEITF